jgi:hypothetical protein
MLSQIQLVPLRLGVSSTLLSVYDYFGGAVPPAADGAASSADASAAATAPSAVAKESVSVEDSAAAKAAAAADALLASGGAVHVESSSFLTIGSPTALESACFQPLRLKRDIPVSKFIFFIWVNLCRYTVAARGSPPGGGLCRGRGVRRTLPPHRYVVVR